MVRDRAQCPPRFAEFHSAILALADGIEPYDKFAAIAKDMNVRPVAAFASQEHVGFKPSISSFGILAYPIWFGYASKPIQF